MRQIRLLGRRDENRREQGVVHQPARVGRSPQQGEPTQVPVDYDEVARAAYALWEQRGGIHGYDVEDWCEAERVIRTRPA